MAAKAGPLRDGKLQYRGRLDASGRQPAAPDTRRELYEAMKLVAAAGAGAQHFHGLKVVAAEELKGVVRRKDWTAEELMSEGFSITRSRMWTGTLCFVSRLRRALQR